MLTASCTEPSRSHYQLIDNDAQRWMHSGGGASTTLFEQKVLGDSAEEDVRVS